jgi:hypothetical protein
MPNCQFADRKQKVLDKHGHLVGYKKPDVARSSSKPPTNREE